MQVSMLVNKLNFCNFSFHVYFFFITRFMNDTNVQFTCYISSICAPIKKLYFWNIDEICSSVTNVQFVHQHWNLHIFNIYENGSFVIYFSFAHLYQNRMFETWMKFVHQHKKCTSFIHMKTVHLLHKFNLFTHIKTCVCEISIKFVHLLQKFNLFCSIETFASLIHMKTVHLLHKFILLTHVKICTFEKLMTFVISYKSSICSPVLKIALL